MVTYNLTATQNFLVTEVNLTLQEAPLGSRAGQRRAPRQLRINIGAGSFKGRLKVPLQGGGGVLFVKGLIFGRLRG